MLQSLKSAPQKRACAGYGTSVPSDKRIFVLFQPLLTLHVPDKRRLHGGHDIEAPLAWVFGQKDIFSCLHRDSWLKLPRYKLSHTKLPQANSSLWEMGGPCGQNFCLKTCQANFLYMYEDSSTLWNLDH